MAQFSTSSITWAVSSVSVQVLSFGSTVLVSRHVLEFVVWRHFYNISIHFCYFFSIFRVCVPVLHYGIPGVVLRYNPWCRRQKRRRHVAWAVCVSRGPAMWDGSALPVADAVSGILRTVGAYWRLSPRRSHVRHQCHARAPRQWPDVSQELHVFVLLVH